jgi:hypothetical protein
MQGHVPCASWIVSFVSFLMLQVACCDMIPPFPDFPTEWRATVEANIINQGYTYVQRETYSEAHVRLLATVYRPDRLGLHASRMQASRTVMLTIPGESFREVLLRCMQNKVRVDLHSYDSEIVMVQDYGTKKTTIIYPANTTYPQGVCQVWMHQ